MGERWGSEAFPVKSDPFWCALLLYCGVLFLILRLHDGYTVCGSVL